MSLTRTLGAIVGPQVRLASTVARAAPAAVRKQTDQARTASRAPSLPASDTPPPPPPIEDFDFADPTLPAKSTLSKPWTAAAAQPVASPPLTELPGESYRPLPVASARIPGEQPTIDWNTSFAGLSDKPFPKEVADELLQPLKPEDVEIKPDGLLYLPEIKYRRTLNKAFGPGGWGLAPRGETQVTDRLVSREWGLVCLGRLVSVARGEQDYFDPSGIPTATEGCKSNALMRCCKDLGIASELWDPSYVREYRAKYCVDVWTENSAKKKRKLWRKKDAPKFTGPWKE